MPPLTPCTVLSQAGSAVRGLSTNDIRRRWFPGWGSRWWIHPATLAAAAPVPPHAVMDQDYGVCGTLQKAIATLHAHARHGARQTRQHTLVQAGSPGVRHRDRHVRSVPCSHARLRRFSERSMASRTSSARLVCSASAKRSSAASWLFRKCMLTVTRGSSSHPCFRGRPPRGARAAAILCPSFPPWVVSRTTFHHSPH
jgi:hypothetical protein